jgi:hypothetical protein
MELNLQLINVEGWNRKKHKLKKRKNKEQTRANLLNLSQFSKLTSYEILNLSSIKKFNSQLI